MKSNNIKLIATMVLLGSIVGGGIVAVFYNGMEREKTVGKWDDSTWLRSEVKQLVLDKNFHQLERMVHEARTEKLRYKTTAWVLQDLYNAIPYTQSTYESIYRLVDEWRKELPESNIPDIIESRAFVARAWEIRGNAKSRDLSGN